MERAENKRSEGDGACSPASSYDPLIAATPPVGGCQNKPRASDAFLTKIIRFRDGADLAEWAMRPSTCSSAAAAGERRPHRFGNAREAGRAGQDFGVAGEGTVFFRSHGLLPSASRSQGRAVVAFFSSSAAFARSDLTCSRSDSGSLPAGSSACARTGRPVSRMTARNFVIPGVSRSTPSCPI